MMTYKDINSIYIEQSGIFLLNRRKYSWNLSIFHCHLSQIGFFYNQQQYLLSETRFSFTCLVADRQSSAPG